MKFQELIYASDPHQLLRANYTLVTAETLVRDGARLQSGPGPRCWDSSADGAAADDLSPIRRRWLE